MNALDIPVPGYWYINRDGKLMRVRFVAYAGSRPRAVLIQNIDGQTRVIGFENWCRLDLVVPCPEPGRPLLESEQGL